jgi:two-component system alkaline phosphatase synthesis response regulator PhoP
MAACIWLFDDDAAILGLLTDVLEEQGYDVHVSPTPVPDPRRLAAAECDLIILDYLLRGQQTAWPALQALRANPDTAHIPIVLCTAATSQVQTIAPWLEAEGIPLVLKPFDLDELLSAVTDALPAHRV